METEDAVLEQQEGQLGLESLQCHATIHNNTPYRLTVNRIDPGMWGKWIQSPTDIPAYSQGGFSAQGRASSPSGTEATLTYTLSGSDPGAIITLTFDVPYSGKNRYTIRCSPQGAFRVKQTNNGEKCDHGKVTYHIDTP